MNITSLACQLTDTGIQPGSGVGNHRLGLTQETLGVKVIAVGVPMVVYASTIASDALGDLVRTGGGSEADEEKLITAAAASSIEFDNELNSVFRKLCFTMEFCLCEEGSA